MKPGITRWKIVPGSNGRRVIWPVFGSFHSLRPSVRSMKFFVVIGDSASKNLKTITPRFVVIVAYRPGGRAAGVAAGVAAGAFAGAFPSACPHRVAAHSTHT